MAEIRILNEVGATVIINGEERESVVVARGSHVTWSVTKEGYVGQSGELDVDEDTVLPVRLKREEYTITFNVSPTDATLTVNGSAVKLTDGNYTMTAKWGDTVSWSCEAVGYIGQNGNFTATEDKTVNVTLEEEVVEPAIWFERDGVKIDSLSLDCSGDRIEVDVRTSRDDVMWQVDEYQLGDWGDIQLYIRPKEGTGPGKVTIYRDMNDTSTFGAWSVDVMFHYGLTSSYESGTEVLTVERMECEVNHLYWENRTLIIPFSKASEEHFVTLHSNLGWQLSQESYNEEHFDLYLSKMSGEGDAEIGITPSHFSETEPFDHIVTATSTTGGYSDELYVHIRSANEEGEGIAFYDGLYYDVEKEAVDTTYEHSLKFKIKTFNGVHGIGISTDIWKEVLGTRYGISGVTVNGQTLTRFGSVSVEPLTEYEVEIRWYNYLCSEDNLYGYNSGFGCEMRFDALDSNGQTTSENEIQIFTSNANSGPVT